MKTSTLSPKKVKIWGNGQITIPNIFRKAYGLENETVVTIEPRNKFLYIIPDEKIEDRDKTVREEMKKNGLSLADLLEGLEEERKISYKEQLENE